MTEARAARWRLRLEDEVASTSVLLRTLAEQGEPGGLAILARRQTAGRGSRGRSWLGAEGNLFLSALLRPGTPAGKAAQWSLLAGVAVHEALVPMLPTGAVLRLKWPNDLLLNGRKVAGILVNSAADRADNLAWVVIGVGANLASAPDIPGHAAASLDEVVPAPRPEEVAKAVLDRLAHWEAIYVRGGFAPVREAWLLHGPDLGEAVRFRHDDQVIEGAFAGLDGEGGLLIERAGLAESFSTGEVLQGD